MEASKWLSLQVLVDADEMEELLLVLGDFSIYQISGVTEKGAGKIDKAAFLSCYTEYIKALKKGEMPLESTYRALFSSAWSVDPNAVQTIAVNEKQQLQRVVCPVVQLQNHRMDYSEHDGKFRPMVFGQHTILWGIQFSYPQLFRNPKTQVVEQVRDDFQNTDLFRRLQKWVRHHTVPTPFVVSGNKINVPMRLGKKCLEWINSHPQLRERKISIFL